MMSKPITIQSKVDRLWIKQLLGLNGSTGSIRSRRSRHRHSDLRLIFISFRRLKAAMGIS
jgi:hypothetical protein